MIVFPVRGGVLAVPAVLPIHVSDDELKLTVADWLARGAPGAPTAFLDPADHLVAGLTARLADGRSYLDRTTETVIEIIRRDCVTNGKNDIIARIT